MSADTVARVVDVNGNPVVWANLPVDVRVRAAVDTIQAVWNSIDDPALVVRAFATVGGRYLAVNVLQASIEDAPLLVTPERACEQFQESFLSAFTAVMAKHRS